MTGTRNCISRQGFDIRDRRLQCEDLRLLMVNQHWCPTSASRGAPKKTFHSGLQIG